MWARASFPAREPQTHAERGAAPFAGPDVLHTRLTVPILSRAPAQLSEPEVRPVGFHLVLSHTPWKWALAQVSHPGASACAAGSPVRVPQPAPSPRARCSPAYPGADLLHQAPVLRPAVALRLCPIPHFGEDMELREIKCNAGAWRHFPSLSAHETVITSSGGESPLFQQLSPSHTEQSHVFACTCSFSGFLQKRPSVCVNMHFTLTTGCEDGPMKEPRARRAPGFSQHHSAQTRCPHGPPAAARPGRGPGAGGVTVRMRAGDGHLPTLVPGSTGARGQAPMKSC